FETLACNLILMFNRLVRVSGTAHEDTQTLTRFRLHGTERLLQKLSSVGLHLHRLSPNSRSTRRKMTQLPVGKELCITIQATGRLSKAASHISRQGMSERVRV